MTLHNIHVIARYEVKLLKRSWLFRIFAILALLGITMTMLGSQTAVFNKFSFIWPKIALSSLMPFANVYYYNIAQSVIVIFLAGSFLKRDKKLDTAEVIYVRPMSNADYIIGKTWGILKVFISLNMISLLITAFLNLFINRSPFDIFPYLFYLLTISVPSLLFVLGLSFTVMCLLKNQAVTFIVMLGITGLVFFYLTDTLYGVFDFFGVNIPAIFSDVTGHADLRQFLLQRIIYLFLGLGFISFTIALVKRLPHKPWKTIIVYFLGTVFVVAGCLSGLFYVLHYRHQIQLRNNYIAIYNQYAERASARIVTHNLTVTPQGNHLQGKSELTLLNPHTETLNSIILYLNPSLQVTAMESKGEKIPFTRENQSIVVEKNLTGGEKLSLTIQYEGNINETICYTDVLEKDYINTQLPEKNYRFGKRYAWLENKFTLLTPECLWYPVAVAPAIPKAPYSVQKDFTHYTLTVVGQNTRTLLSQGESQTSEDRTVFTNRFPLPGISLTIADYEKKSLQVDSISYEIYYFKGHDYFSSYFTQLHDTLPGILRELKNDTEISKGRDYPFGKFVLAETPAQFATYTRNWKGYSEYVQPEIVFVPERGCLWNSDFKAEILRYKEWRNPNQGPLDEVEMLGNTFRRFVNGTLKQENINYGWNWNDQYINPFNISPLFFGFNSFVHSNEYPIIDITLNTLQNTASSIERYRVWGGIINNKQRANLYLETHSLKTAIADTALKPEIFYELLKLKSTALRNYITAQISAEQLNDFLKDFFTRHRSAIVPFDSLNRQMQQKLGLSLHDFLQRWYTEDHSPTLFIKEADANQIILDEITKYQVKFKIYNPSDVDAIITAQIQQGGGFGGGRRGGGWSDNQVMKNYIIPAQSAQEVKIITDERPADLTVSTNISHNLPTLYNFNFGKIENTIDDTIDGMFRVDPKIFDPNPNEIIVDNEDPGFKTIVSNNRHKLKDLFKKKDEEKYKNFMPWWLPSQWTYMAADYCYGATICSAVYKNKGSGANAVEWQAEISRDGYYEVAIWNPKMGRGTFRMGRRGRGKNERNQTYTIESEQEKESVTLDLEQESEGWVSLGNFYLTQGTVKIRLTDKVSGDYVIADAVKFTFTD